MVPYPNASRPVGTQNPIPASIATGTTYDTGVMQSQGANISVWVKATQALTMHIIQYADAAGTITVQDTSQAVSANTQTNKVVADGKAFVSWKITLANASGSLATLNNLNPLQN
jgi:hypothetical protein